MKTLIFKPKIGQKIKSKHAGIQGKVVGLIDYNEATDRYLPEERRKLNAELELMLGDEFRDLYYEAIIKVHYATKASTYKRGELAIVSWQDLQDAIVL